MRHFQHKSGRPKHVAGVVLVALAMVAAGACHPQDDDAPEAREFEAPTHVEAAPVASQGVLRQTGGSKFRGDTGALIDRLDARISFFEQRTQSDNESWVDHANIARTYLTRARLTSRWEDYRGAEHALRDAFDVAPGQSGPLLTRIRYHGAVHRFGQMETDLAALDARPAIARDPLTLESIRSELDLQRGDVGSAIERLEWVFERQETAASAARLGHLYFKTGRHADAERLYERAQTLARTASPLARAWVELQRGIFDLERGRLDAALADFQSADDILSGWYLVEEHIAEILASTGRLDEAIAMYRDILERVPNGEFYDALADTLVAAGSPDKAAQARQKARSAYEEDIAAYPESAWGHAIGHYLVHGPVSRALDLARSNWQIRTSPTAQIALVQALVRADELDEAYEHTVELVEGTWDTPDMHATAAVVFELRDEQERAEIHRQRAEALRAGTMGEFEWLIPQDG